MKEFILLITILTIQISFASNPNINIKNAKIGSTIITDFGTLNYGLTVDGHTAIVIDEYEGQFETRFVITMDGNKVNYYCHSGNLNGNSYLGHFRAVSRNYTSKEREDIRKAVIKAANSNTEYEFLNLYTYDWDSDHKNNIPYQNTIPTDFRCDGLSEWATEIGMNPTNPKENDGFYSINTAFHRPISITADPVDKIGTPDKPILSIIDEGIMIEFPEVSGAWSEALYVVYKSKSLNTSNLSKDDIIYCDYNKLKNYIDDRTNEEENTQYYYFLKVGERTALCDEMTYFSELSEYSTLKRFMVSDSNDTIVDTQTSLIWNNTKLPTLNWTDSSNKCDTLQLDSYERWRIPTLSELQSIVDPIDINHVYKEFTQLSDKPFGYWSSNKFFGYNPWMPWLGLKEQAFVFSYKNNFVSSHNITYQMNLICVRQMY